MKHPDEETISKIHKDSALSVVGNFVKIDRLIREESGICLSEKSPIALALLCVSTGIDFHAGILFHKLDSISGSSIDSNDVSNLCHQMSLSSGDVLEGLTRCAGEIGRLACAVEGIGIPKGKKRG
ncbi:hypothetical protein Nit79A3_2597 [Nitrosomonas sp. Is79A3]|uniref:hypothetical protein n=1 Tax=Nitrosomonas sp. (strain Is79A3) TaxID=261292 RepID=UPI000215CE49